MAKPVQVTPVPTGATPNPGDAITGLSEAWDKLTLDGRKARYGVTYVRSICAQAGVPFHENSPDEDVLAVDCDIKFRRGNVSAQIKCTSTRKITGRGITWPVKARWVENWQKFGVPVYLIIVVVQGDIADWIEHDLTEGTFHRAAAYWRRILPDEIIGASISIPKDQRLQASTLGLWNSDLLQCFNTVRSTQ